VIAVHNPKGKKAPLMGIIINRWKYSLPAGKTYVFEDEVGNDFLNRCGWLKKVPVTAKIPKAPRERPTEAEAPALYVILKQEGKLEEFLNEGKEETHDSTETITTEEFQELEGVEDIS